MVGTDAFVVRNAHARELPLLGLLEDRAGRRFRDSAHPYAADLPHFDAALLALLQRAGSVWVAASVSDAPIGFAVAGELGGEAYLHELDVEIAHGRRGVGRALLAQVMTWARGRGHGSLLLSTFSDVAWNAPYYERLGFATVPLADYSDAMREQRASDSKSGLRLESRVMMRRKL